MSDYIGPGGTLLVLALAAILIVAIVANAIIAVAVQVERVVPA